MHPALADLQRTAENGHRAAALSHTDQFRAATIPDTRWAA